MQTRRILPFLVTLFVALPSRAAITGTVVTPEGKAIAGARVSLYAREAESARRARLLSASPEAVPIASLQTDAKGTFSIPSPKEGVVILTATVRGFEPAQRTIERDEEVGAFLLAPAAMQTGSVTAAGKPVPNTVVSIIFQSREYFTRTDEQGRYEAPDIGRATSITVFHPDFALDTESFFVMGGKVGSGELRRTLIAGQKRSGKVVDLDGKTPVAGATIFIDGWPMAKSGEDGTFSIARTPAKWAKLIAGKDGRFGERTWRGDGELSVRLTRGAMLSGRVLDAKTRVALPSVLVRTSARRMGSPDPEFPVEAVSDAKGNYTLRAPAGNWLLIALHPAYATETVEVNAVSQTSRDLALQPLARVSGMVVDEARKPVAAASVGAEEGQPVMGRPMVRSTMPALTQPDGRFFLRLPGGDGETRLRASKKGLPAGRSDAIRIAPGDRKSGVTISIPSGIEVTGFVSDPEGEPLSGITVSTSETPRGPRGGRQTFFGGPPQRDDDLVRTASDGTFSLRLQEGSWDFTFRGEGYAAGVVRAQTVAPGAENDIEIELERAVGITGRVTRGGAPVEGVTVISFVSMEPSTATTGPDGSFTLSGLTPGSVGVMLRKQEEMIQEQRTLTAPATDVEIELPAGGRVTGRVVEKGSKKAIPSFQAGISVSRSGGGMVMMAPPMMQSFSSDDGSFTLDHVPAGAVNLVASAAGYASGKLNLQVETGKEVAGVEIELDAGVRLFGKVTGANGSPLSDASVRVARTPGRTFAMDDRRATTDAGGEYSIEGLEPGDETLEVSHATHVTAQKPVSLSGKDVRLDVQLDAGGRVRGVVVSESGSPVAEADVSVWGNNNFRTAGRSSADGSFEIDGLAPGRYIFQATKNGFAEGRVEDFDISSGAPLRITLRSGGVIHGRVSGVEARDLAQTNVRVMGGGTQMLGAVDPEGNYKVEGVPAGTMQVSAFVTSRAMSGSRSSAVKSVEMPAGGSQQVDIEFHGDVVIEGRVTRNGEPLTGATVQFSPRTAAAQTASNGTTDGQGFYSVTGLDPGEYNVATFDMQRFTSHMTTYAVHGSATFDIEFSAVSLRGRVIDAATGEPIAEALVQLRQAAFAETTRMSRAAQTDTSGAFTLDFVSPGGWTVTASKDGFGSQVLEVQVGDRAIDDLELKLSANDGVTLRIVDARDGRTIRGSVTVFDSLNRAVFESRGGFRGNTLDEIPIPLAPGAYTAAVDATGYGTRMLSFSSPSRQTVGLTPGGTLLVESGQSSRRRIQLIDAAGRRYMHHMSRFGRFDLVPQPGSTTILFVAPGTYSVQLLSEDETTVVDSEQVVVPEGGTARVRL